jgi:hypothetical protein
MRLMVEFQCKHEHITERLVDSDTRQITCPKCGENAIRLMGMPSVRLEPYSGAFPGAYHSWERKRADKIAADNRRNGA